MKKLIDVACSHCGHVEVDVWVEHTDDVVRCRMCGGAARRAWGFVKAPGVTPQGTCPEVNTDRVYEPRVDTKAIAAEKKLEVEQKWARYADETIAEQHISREINHKAGMSDEAGNLLPPPSPAPITFAKPSPAECAV